MDMRRKILVLVDWYLPGYKGGGQIKAVQYIAENLNNEFDFYILCRNYDSDGSVYSGVPSGVWVKSGNVSIKYLSKGDKSYFFSIIQEIAKNGWHTLYLNSYFSFFFSILPALYVKFFPHSFKRIILAPRGEFSPGALNLKADKKMRFIRVARFLGVHDNITWHASTEHESLDIQAVYPGPLIKIAKELLPIAVRSEATYIEKNSGTLRLFFLSRITPKKGLDFALEVLASVRHGIVEFDIYGPIEDAKYWEKCTALIEKLPPNVTARYCGEVPHERISQIIPPYHFLFFPTLGENFGYVIIEAFLSCRPILISDNTPWRDLENAGVGWELPLADKTAFAEKIQFCIGLSQQGFNNFVDQVVRYVDVYLDDNKAIVQSNFELFNG